MDYTAEVRQRFDHPREPAASDDGAMTVSGAAADRSLNVWVRFVVAVADGRIGQIRYNAYGCPHVIAACEWIVEALEGRPVDVLRQPDIGHLSRELGVPREKFGKLLRIEDALGECASRLGSGSRREKVE